MKIKSVCPYGSSVEEAKLDQMFFDFVINILKYYSRKLRVSNGIST